MHPRLILASGSTARKQMLENVGLKFEIKPADIDEASLISSLQKQSKSADEITLALAEEKSKSISEKHPDALVIGSDQTLVFENKIFSKSRTKQEAIDKLLLMQGKTHYLNSGIAISHNKKPIWKYIDTCQLNMCQLTSDFIKIYADKADNILTSCVGGYAIEQHGPWLFSSINGDYYTILGMPLLPLLNYLKTEHGVTP